MKKIFFLINIFIAAQYSVFSQSSNCSTATPFCSGTTSFPASVGAGSAQAGPDYGCLFTQPNPAWFYMQVSTGGNISLTITSSPARDIDFILYGPFTSPTAPCSGQLTAANTEDCSYAGGTAPEIADITGGIPGEYYLLLLTNYSNLATNITFTQTGGTGSTSCAVLCNLSTLTATPTACDPNTNTYSVSGQVTFGGAPSAGTLTVTSSCGGTQTFNAPFTSPLSYTLANLNSNGAACSVTATFSDAPACTKTTNYTSPADCTPCTATPGNNGPVCEGDSLNLTAATVTGATSYSWTGPGGFSSSVQNPVIFPVTVAASGTYTLTVTTPSATCSSTTTVVVSPVPLVDAGSSAGICSGENIQLSGNGSAGTYSWSPASSLDDPTILTPIAMPSVTTNYTLTITDASGCSASSTTTVTILNPNVDAGPDVSLCSGTGTTLNASGGDSYSWSPASGLSSTTVSNPFANPVSTTTYTVVISNSSTGCTAIDSMTVTVTPAVIANAGSDVSICYGDSTSLSATGGTSYAWSPSAGLNNSAIANPMANPFFTTTYTVIVTDAFGCTGTDSVKVSVNQLPVVNAGNDISICIGDSASLLATGAFAYYWIPATGLSNDSIANPMASPAAATTYVVTGTDLNGCVDTDTMMISLNGLTITASANTTICIGDSTQLTAIGAASYVWTPAATLNNATISNPVATPVLPSTTYTVVGTSLAGCRDTAYITVNTNPLPPVNAGTSLSTCVGANANLSVTGANSYVWSPASSLNNAFIPTPIATPAVTTLYTVTGTDLNGCVATDTVSVIVHSLPVVTAGSNTSICQGTSTQLNATGGGTYSWSPASTLSSSTIVNPVAMPSATTTYTVTVMGAGFCTSSAQVTVIVNPVPVANAGPDASICNGNSASLSASGGSTYFWSPSTGLSSTTSANPSASPSATTQYTVTVSNASGCSDQDVVTVNVSNSITIAPSSVTGETCISANGSITTGAPAGGTAPYTYSLNGGTAQTSSTFTSLTQGNYTITVTDAAGCASNQTVTVGQLNNVNASFTANPPTGGKPLSVDFANTSSGASSYIWDFGNGISSLSTNPSTIYLETGSYIVTLVAINGGYPCIDTARFTIEVFEESVVIIPNVFTPNGDGKNDVFMIQSSGVSEINGTIFNRWGKKIYDWNGNANSGWDGKINGAQAEDGTYYYILKIRGADGKEKTEKGYVQLLSR